MTATDTEVPDEPQPGASAATRRGGEPEPALVASGLELRTRQGLVFGPVDWNLPAGRHGAVLGVQGSGRSAFLLTLTGRMRGVSGGLRVGDLDGIRQPRHLRHRTAVARITDLVGLEPSLTIAEMCDEHALSDGVGEHRGRARFAELSGATGHRFNPATRVHDLPAVDRTILSALLACQRRARYVVLDDVDDSLTTTQLAEVYRVLDVLRELGHPFVVSALESSPVPDGAAVVHLPAPQTDDSLALSFGHLRRPLLTKEI